MRYSIMILAAAALAASAQATPVPGHVPLTTPPPVISALGGDVMAVYIFSDAADASALGLGTPPTIHPIFCNAAITGTCASSNSAGNTMDLGNRSGVLQFTLDNTSQGTSYDSIHPDSDGNYHANITTNFSDFGITLTASQQNAVNAALAGLTNITYIGWEDRNAGPPQSDWDYNDLIFAFSRTAPAHNPGVPEPLTLSLLGFGLLGAFGLRRVKKS